VIKTLLKFFGITTLAICVTWLMLTRTVGTRIVPQVTGQTEREAVRNLDRADLEPHVERNFRKSDPPGVVYMQSPVANVKVREGRRVKVFVSLGPARTSMPDLRGLPLTDAKNRLRAVGSEHNVRGGLTLDMVSRTSHATVAPDHVISHFPPPGQEVILGDKVQLLISTGAPKSSVIVPNCVGLTTLEAESKLLESGLMIQRVSRELSSADPGRVIRTTPESGTPLATGDGVALVVSAPKPGRASGQMRVVLIRYVVPLLMVPSPFNLVLADREGPRSIYTGTPTPGKALDFAERVIGDAELKIYIDGILSETKIYKSP